jgi:hypothetical protein
VLNAVLNSAKRKTEEAVDLGVYDVQKCFDTMWSHEAINDAYDLGFKNDKLPLVFLASESANIAVKSSTGMSERSVIRNVIMQGTVWAGMLCTSTMDKLGKIVYDNPAMAYKYRGHVVVPPLEMVDDVLTISKCGATSSAMNSLVNSFMFSKKLVLNKSKCAKIHVGRKSVICPKLLIHKDIMKDSEHEKYLGELIHQNGKQHATLVDRLAKGYGIISNIIALIDDIPLGHRRVQIGLELRQAWLINGLLYNSEIWQQMTEKDKRDLNKIDHILLRKILGSHSKAPVEQLYLETASLSLTDIIKIRRLIYLQVILQRPEGELIKQVYNAMKADPLPDDWSQLIQKDMSDMNLEYSDQEIINMNPTFYKKIIKEKVRAHSFIHFKELQTNHEKGRMNSHIDHKSPQDYLTTNKLTNKQMSLLFNLRCNSVSGIRANFPKQYYGDLQCRLCRKEQDSQIHLLQCSELKTHIGGTVDSRLQPHLWHYRPTDLYHPPYL